MSAIELVFALVKIVIMLGFLLNMAAIATWADRRQSAMIQDRIGPNRAVIMLPSLAVRFILLLPPSFFATLAGFVAVRGAPNAIASDSTVLASEMTVLVTWFSLLVLCFVVRGSGARNGFDRMVGAWTPRSILVVGLLAHVVVFAALRAIPEEQLPMAVRVAHGALALVLSFVAIYSAARVPEGKVPVRLAGTLHAIADTIKMVWKEDFVPKNADRVLHALAPILSMVPPLVTIAVVPFGRSLCLQEGGQKGLDWSDLGRALPAMGPSFKCTNGHAIGLQITDLNVGILYIFAMAGTGVIGAAIAGWASDNKFSLLGGLRAASQMVSYEVAMGLSLIGLFLIYGAVRLGPMVEWQGEHAWGIFVQPFGFLLFLTALLAETKRVPFDQPEGESEIVAGYFVEYSGMKFGMFMTGEYVELITSSMLLTVLFFGGYNVPFLHADGIRIAFGDAMLWSYKLGHVSVVVISVVAFFSKVALMVWAQIFIRHTVPRFRYDQLMRLGWTRLLPFAIANMLVTGVIVLAVQGRTDVEHALQILGDVSQAAVALFGVGALFALLFGLVKPTVRNKLLLSTAQRFAAAAGGVKASPQQA